MSIQFIIAEILAIIGVTLLTISFVQRTRKNLMFYQVISSACNVAYAILKQSYSSAICNLLALVRSILLHKDKNNKFIMWGIAVAGLSLSLIFNTRGWIGVLPAVACVEYTIALIYLEDIRKIKIAALINMLLWSVHDWLLQFWLYAVVDIIDIVLLIIEIVKLTKANKDAKLQGKKG